MIADEATDYSNREQVTVVVQHVAENLEVHEEFLGLFPVKSTDAITRINIIKKVLKIRFLKIRVYLCKDYVDGVIIAQVPWVALKVE